MQSGTTVEAERTSVVRYIQFVSNILEEHGCQFSLRYVQYFWLKMAQKASCTPTDQPPDWPTDRVVYREALLLKNISPISVMPSIIKRVYIHSTKHTLRYRLINWIVNHTNGIRFMQWYIRSRINPVPPSALSSSPVVETTRLSKDTLSTCSLDLVERRCCQWSCSCHCRAAR